MSNFFQRFFSPINNCDLFSKLNLGVLTSDSGVSSNTHLSWHCLQFIYDVSTYLHLNLIHHTNLYHMPTLKQCYSQIICNITAFLICCFFFEFSNILLKTTGQNTEPGRHASGDEPSRCATRGGVDGRGAMGTWDGTYMRGVDGLLRKVGEALFMSSSVRLTAWTTVAIPHGVFKETVISLCVPSLSF